jgi:hypothetical protein
MNQNTRYDYTESFDQDWLSFVIWIKKSNTGTYTFIPQNRPKDKSGLDRLLEPVSIVV